MKVSAINFKNSSITYTARKNKKQKSQQKTNDNYKHNYMQNAQVIAEQAKQQLLLPKLIKQAQKLAQTKTNEAENLRKEASEKYDEISKIYENCESKDPKVLVLKKFDFDDDEIEYLEEIKDGKLIRRSRFFDGELSSFEEYGEDSKTDRYEFGCYELTRLDKGCEKLSNQAEKINESYIFENLQLSEYSRNSINALPQGSMVKADEILTLDSKGNPYEYIQSYRKEIDYTYGQPAIIEKATHRLHMWPAPNFKKSNSQIASYENNQQNVRFTK